MLTLLRDDQSTGPRASHRPAFGGTDHLLIGVEESGLGITCAVGSSVVLSRIAVEIGLDEESHRGAADSKSHLWLGTSRFGRRVDFLAHVFSGVAVAFRWKIGPASNVPDGNCWPAS